MKLEDQICSLELSKKLKELGVKQESLFFWVTRDEKFNAGLPTYPEIVYEKSLKHRIAYINCEIGGSAFTPSELLEILPAAIEINNENLGLAIIIDTIDYNLIYGDTKNIFIRDENLANACAKMLIYLIENKLFEVI